MKSIAFVNTLFLLSLLVCFNNGQDIVPSDPSDSLTCEEMLTTFALNTGNFTYCAISHGRPIRLCLQCIKYYLNVRGVYDEISNLTPTGSEKCDLFNLDRLQVVNSGFQYVTDLWDRGNCDSCFVLDGVKCPTETRKPIVQKMLDVYSEFRMCVKNHTNDSSADMYDVSLCQDCRKSYSQMNNLYSQVKGASGEEPICMDITDLMNRTRVEWSTTLGCYVDMKRPEVIYLVITGIVGLVPLLFYCCTWGFISKKQQLIALQNNIPAYLRQFSSQSAVSR